MRGAVLTFVFASDTSFRRVVEETFSLFDNPSYEMIESKTGKILCYLATPVDEESWNRIAQMRWFFGIVTFLVPADLLENVESGRGVPGDLAPAEHFEVVSYETVLGGLKFNTKDDRAGMLVAKMLHEIRNCPESRFVRLANMAVLYLLRQL